MVALPEDFKCFVKPKDSIIPEESKCIVETTDGPVCGYKDNTDDGTYYKFKSIPYAQPPLGSLRFLPPSPIQSWTEVKDCTKDAPLPLQNYYKSEIFGSEDCLYIELSTPTLQADKALPVMFWIGCYSFACCMDSIYDPSLINTRDVIFVRCGFRMGPFGFLSTNDYTAPGNCGLKDIVLALKWVQRNISAFGGDPNNVTIFGSSAGGTIVHLMMLSPMATGLFHKAIIQSASALNNCTIAKNASQPAVELAKTLGIDKSYGIEIVDVLRSIPAKDIMNAFITMSNQMVDLKTVNIFDGLFKPCIEIEFEGQPAFLTKSPIKILKSGNFNRVPLIIGSNYIEGAVLQYITTDFYKDYENINENLERIVPKALGGDENLAKSIGHQLLKFYLGGEEQLTEDTKMQYMQMIGDYHFIYYMNKTVRLHSQFAPECPIYYYILNYAGEWSVPPEYRYFNCLGHGAEIPFIFRLNIPNLPVCKGSRDSVTTRKRIVKMWSNFAKYGNPTPKEDDPLLQLKWEPVENRDKLNYLSIGSELTKGRNPFHERIAFWDDLHKEHTLLRTLVYLNDLCM